jgi:hypothetical protein
MAKTNIGFAELLTRLTINEIICMIGRYPIRTIQVRLLLFLILRSCSEYLISSLFDETIFQNITARITWIKSVSFLDQS